MSLRLNSILLFLPLALRAADPGPPADAAGNQNPIVMSPVVVTGKLDTAREDIVPSLGASTFSVSSAQIELQPLGANAPLSQIILQAPGVTQDSAANGDLHVRGEHGNLQYRINDVLLPEGLSGFGLELDPRFVGSMQLVTGSLPAQYGFRTAGVLDIHTKTGSVDRRAEADLTAGGVDTVKASLESSGATKASGYFVDGSSTHSGIGIESPTASATPVHDTTDQSRAFAYWSRVFDRSGRISVMGSVSASAFQVPDTPGLPPGSSPDGRPWLPGTFDSAKLDEHQDERNAYLIVAYQASRDGLNLQVAGYGRYSRVHFIPDPVGDLFFNGVASDVDRTIASGGLQADASYWGGGAHTVRAGAMVLNERLTANTTTTVFPVDPNGDATGAPFPIVDNRGAHAVFLGLYLQDEWKPTARLTLNYGARFDVYTSSQDRESQASPRVNLIYRPPGAATFHAGYARYFTPPSLENTTAPAPAGFAGTSNAPAVTQNDPVKSERADYLDAGVSLSLSPRVQVGLDGYYKNARNQLDDGLFGQSLIQSAFNYRRGRIAGAELTASYSAGGFSAYANLARSDARGKDWISSQFLFSPANLAYVRDHWIYLDHDQRVSASGGVSYIWHRVGGSTRAYLDLLYGTGLRADATDSQGSTIPNGGSVPGHVVVNLGTEWRFNLDRGRVLKLRLDVANLLDRIYELRNGTGVGVNAAQFGQRRAVFGSVGMSF